MNKDPYRPPQTEVRDIPPVTTGPRWLRKQLARLGWLAALTFVAFIALFPAFKASAGNHLIDPVAFVGLVLLVSNIAYLVALGILAQRLGRSWIINCFMSLLLFPFGVIVSYLVMRRAVGRAVQAAGEWPEHG